MALDSLTSQLSVSMNWTAQKNIAGSTDYSPNQNNTTITKKSSVGTAAANAAVGGGDELASWVQTIAGGGTATVDLSSLTNILQTTAISLARVKGIMIRLLSTTDDATNGTACTHIVVGNAASNAWTSQSGGRGWLTSSTHTFDIGNGGAVAFLFPTAAGVLVDGTHKNILITNGDGSVSAKVQISLHGGTT